jgi:hypothetical protein
LIVPGENLLVIFDEPIVVVSYGVRRIRKDEITTPSTVDGAFEVAALQGRIS